MTDQTARSGTQRPAKHPSPEVPTPGDSTPDRSDRLTQERWRKATEWPLTIAAIAFVIAYAWQVLADLDPPDDAIAAVIAWVVWGMFAVDYVVNLVLAEQRGRWFVTHLFELLVVVLPLLRPLRLLRLLSLLAILQRAAGDELRGRVVAYTIGASILVVGLSALAMLETERDAPESRITSFSDALWWAVVTITSVGYGDEYPVTGTGRIIALAVMIAGLALLGTITATLASLLFDRLADDRTRERAATRADLDELEGEIERLRRLLPQGSAEEQRSGASALPPPPRETRD